MPSRDSKFLCLFCQSALHNETLLLKTPLFSKRALFLLERSSQQKIVFAEKNKNKNCGKGLLSKRFLLKRPRNVRRERSSQQKILFAEKNKNKNCWKGLLSKRFLLKRSRNVRGLPVVVTLQHDLTIELTFGKEKGFI